MSLPPKSESPPVTGGLSPRARCAQNPWRQAFPILNIFVPHTGHFPSVAGFPFFIVIAFASFISRRSRHFKQYASNEPSFFRHATDPAN